LKAEWVGEKTPGFLVRELGSQWSAGRSDETEVDFEKAQITGGQPAHCQESEVIQGAENRSIRRLSEIEGLHQPQLTVNLVGRHTDLPQNFGQSLQESVFERMKIAGGQQDRQARPFTEQQQVVTTPREQDIGVPVP
jgi:hypothetical protein